MTPKSDNCRLLRSVTLFASCFADIGITGSVSLGRITQPFAFPNPFCGVPPSIRMRQRNGYSNVMVKIGGFSKLGRVTVKTLRYWDEIGLLRPDYVNPDNGYRTIQSAR